MKSHLRTLRSPIATGALVVASTVAPASLTAQEPVDSLRLEVARLAALVDSLSGEVERLRATGQEEEAGDALARLRQAAAAAAAAGGGGEPEARAGEQQFVGRQRSMQALNPEISMNVNMFGHIDKDATRENNFFVREFELAIVSNLDPFSRAKVFISRESPGGEISPFPEPEEEEAGEFSVEEGYVEWVALPGNLSLKLGRFFQQFGQLNRWHSHALYFQSRSLPHLAFIGEENLGQTGASLHWLMPFGGRGGGAYEATIEVTRKDNEVLFGGAAGLSVLGNLNGFWTLSESTDLDVSLSWVNGHYDDGTQDVDRNLYGGEFAFTWRPPGRSLYRGVVWRGGVMALDGLVGPADPDQTAWGVWTLGEVRLSQSWLAGARFGRTDNPADPTQTAWLVSPTVTWWQSEFVRLRAEYDLLGRSFLTDRSGQLLLQITFAMGPHKHETY